MEAHSMLCVENSVSDGPSWGLQVRLLLGCRVEMKNVPRTPCVAADPDMLACPPSACADWLPSFCIRNLMVVFLAVVFTPQGP
jgi:hypothetical protein